MSTQTIGTLDGETPTGESWAPARDDAVALAVDPLPVPYRVIRDIVEAGLAEDNPTGDLTGNVLLPADATATADVIAREPGILAGLGVFEAAMTLTDPAAAVTTALADGQRFAAGDVLATVTGPARAVLAGERVGLNLLQRLSGIATATRAFVDAAAGTGTRIADTRKTTPGLRALERYAVRCGGGHNHRGTLSEAVMAKDNHLALLGTGDDLTRALRAARARLGHTVHFEVEIDSLDQLDAVLAAGVDTIMLDNFSLADLAEGVRRIAGAALVEASGNVRLDTVADIAATGVDVISSGSLTHSVRALDLGLDVRITDGRAPVGGRSGTGDPQ
ncbi:carboxylating nicotinate-nucleotide diphosphorylase [Arthrobacter rhombi]|uniref:carboxylating nicotinate-nucleotide diphosphorylase n=1 Tax=Arthrobacter rhombi TaxID=71253 RepID=UPI0031D85EE3